MLRRFSSLDLTFVVALHCHSHSLLFQAQDDYLDCFGDPEVIGKIGTDIEDNKCGWLICKGLEKMSDQQKQVVAENYGKKDAACVSRIKALYREIDVESDFKAYENASYDRLKLLIESQAYVPPSFYPNYLSIFINCFKIEIIYLQ